MTGIGKSINSKKIFLKTSVDLKLSAWLIAGFILFTVIGTVSHELAHFIAANFLGYTAEINYGFTFYEEVVNPKDAFIITLCGPLQTMATGTIGLLLTIRYRHDFFVAVKLKFSQWLVIFISMFWLRELFNGMNLIFRYMLTGVFPAHNDEVSLAVQLNLPKTAFAIPTALIAALILGFIVFKFIPRGQRLTFLISGLAGGILGFYLWFRLIGPAIMP